MALNKLMHPRNPFKDIKPDFKALAAKYEEFKKYVYEDAKGKVHMDFKKAENLRALTWALMKDQFGVDLSMPLDRLIPTVPLRINYILWLEDIISDRPNVRGIDIGCGSSCVYAIIGAKKNSWKYLVSESDSVNVTYAQKNVKENGLDSFIEVRKVDEDVMLNELLMEQDGQFDFCMCNPPFYGSNLEAWGLTGARDEERAEPHSINTASPSESITPGGEVAFVKRLITDSLLLHKKVRVYTTMLGKKSSLFPLKEELRRNGITHFAWTEFCQGRTMRWGLGWSFDDTVTFPKPPSKQVKTVKEKPPLVYKVPRELGSLKYNLTDIGARIMSMLDELKIMYEPESCSPDKLTLEMIAVTNTWSHQRRKRRAKKLATRQADLQPSATVASEAPTETTNNAQPSCIHPTETNTSQCSQSLQPCDNSHISACGEANNVVSGSVPDKAVTTDCATITECSDVNSNTSAPPKKRPSDSDDSDPKRTKVDTDDLELSFDDVMEFLAKCHLKLHKDADDILLELKWLGGSSLGSLHEIMQYFKNNLK